MAHWLTERMAGWPDRPAIVWRDRTTTYAELLDIVQAWEGRLADCGEVVAIEGDYSPLAVSLLLAVFLGRRVVVPLTRSVQAQREEFCRIAQVQSVVRLAGDDSWEIETRDAQVDHPLLRKLLDAGTPGLVLFTSGSTGTSKAALHDLAVLLEKFERRRHRLCTMTFLLLDHIGGLNTLFYTLANGGTVVSVAARDADAVCRAIATHKVELVPTTPSFLNLLLISEAYKRHDLSSLKRVTYGTEVMPEATLHRIREVLPAVELQQTYGLTEVGILRSKSRDAGSLMVKIGGEGYETKVVDGCLWIRARSAMLGYLNAPSPFDADGWFNTQDAVEVEGEYVRILGRKTEIVNVGGQKVHPIEVENVLLQLDNVREVAVYPEPNPMLGQVVAARVTLIEPEDPAAFRKRLRQFAASRLAPFKVPAKVTIVQDDPVGPRFKKIRHA